MGLFNKIKNLFKKEEIEQVDLEEEKEEEPIAVKLESPIQEEEPNVELIVHELKEEEKRKELQRLAIEKQKRLDEEKRLAEKQKKKEQILEDDKKQQLKEVKIYEKGLTKTRQSFVSRLVELTNRAKKIDDAYFDELEEILFMADIGVHTVMNFMDRLKNRVKKEKIEDPEYLKEVIVDELFIIYVNDQVLVDKIQYAKEGPTVILFVGVNGVGKTTTIAKIAWKLKNEGKKVLLVAGDTFRAGATKQLREWSEKIDVAFSGREEGADPSAVIFDGVTRAKEEDFDVVLIDTAGRLQNKVNLMKELEKMNRVIGNLIPEAPQETLLVIDATTGQNGISQAKSFQEITNITGIVLTKLDGTAKGGIVLAIKEETKLPVKYIGLGERKEDLQNFDIEKYIYGLFKDLM